MGFGRDVGLLWLQAIWVHAQTHGTARLPPVEASLKHTKRDEAAVIHKCMFL